MQARRITTLGFDADDTLWHNEQYFKLTERRFQDLLAPYAGEIDLPARLLEAERRNIGHYGFGVKGFTLSMIETAIEVTRGRVPASVIAEIMAGGREMLAHPVETFPGVRETLEALAGTYRLVVITKGDLFDQERKVAQSGLGDLFTGVEIVSDKTPAVYDRIFRRHGDGADNALMAGNSLKSDVLPAIAAGAVGVHVPHEHAWALEHADDPVDDGRFHRIDTLSELPALLARIG